jgi:HD-like signal output (HDOD) protein
MLFAKRSDKVDVVECSELKTGPGPAAQQIFRQTALQSLSQLPPFSPILNRVLASLTGEDVSYAKLSDLIEKDTVLSGNILNLVNSALYGRSRTINSVRHAVSLLGMGKLRNAVLGMSITRMWSRAHMPDSWSMARFNMHSAATAILSDSLAQRLPVKYPEGAFVAGLLHDLGRLLIATGLPKQHQEILRLLAPGDRSHVECELEVLGFTHAGLSAEALAVWNIPEPIQAAVRDHHNATSSDAAGTPAAIPLSALLDAADQYVNSTGVTILSGVPADAADSALIESLGLDEKRLGTLIAEYQAEFAAMAQFFS